MQTRLLLVVLVASSPQGFMAGSPIEFSQEQLAILTQKETEEANKAICQKVIEGFNNRDLSVVDKYYVANGFIQHDPNIADGTHGLKEHLQAAFAKHPGKMSKMEILRVAADGDLVFVHLKKASPESGNPVSLIHVYRLTNSTSASGGLKKIVEHWALFVELTPQIVAASKNRHPLF